MIAVTIEIKERSLVQRFGKMPAAVIQGVTEGMRELGIELSRGMIAAIPHRTGAARKSIGFELRASGLIPDLAVGAILAPPPYMRMLDKGGTIKPRNARYLTIPFKAARTPSSAFARFTARQVISSPESAGYTGTFIRNGIIFGVKGEGDSRTIEPLFKLVDQVTQKATNGGRGWLGATFDDALKRGVHREKIDAAVKRKLAALGGGGAS